MAMKTNKPAPSAKKPDATAQTAQTRRLKYGLSSTLLVLGLMLILAVVNWLGSDVSRRFDLTARGQYSISEQTRRLLKSIDDEITITMVFAERDQTVSTDQQRARAADRRQVEDVLTELRNASSRLNVERLDPTDPRTVTKYDALIERLNKVFSGEIETYKTAIDRASDTYHELAEFAGPQSDVVIEAIGSLSPQHTDFRTFQTIAQVLAIIPGEVETIDRRIDRFLTVDAARGVRFPDLDGARSTVRAALLQRAPTMSTIAEFYTKAIEDETLPDTLRDRIRNLPGRFESLASRMQDDADALADLPPLKLSSINYALSSKNCVLVENATNAVAISYNRLFPPQSAGQFNAGEGMDQRFAGETILASGIRQLTLTDPPVLFVVHAEQSPTILRGSPNSVDLGSVAMQMRDLGFDVREWNVLQGPRPELPDKMTGKPAWVFVPPPPTQQVTPSAVQLADAARALIEEGHNVMISLFPSVVTGMGQMDPWQSLITPLGLKADLERVVMERIPQPGAQDAFTAQFEAVDFQTDHPIARAVDGQPTLLEYPIPIHVADDSTFEHNSLFVIKPSERIWATADWVVQQAPTPPAQRDTDPYPIIVTARRKEGPLSGQRILVVGSGQWFWTSRTGLYQLTGNVQLPLYPGNSELFSAGVCWLSQVDTMIARSARAESVPRIEELSPAGKVVWQWLLVGGLPLVVLLTGLGVGLSRRG